jgi:hypothetical protein
MFNSILGAYDEGSSGFGRQNERLRKCLDAAPAAWYPYDPDGTRGLANGILAVGNGYKTTLSAPPGRDELFLSVLLKSDVRMEHLRSRAMLQLQQIAQFTRVMPDFETHVLRLLASTHCPDGTRLPYIVRNLFHDAGRLLVDDRFSQILVDLH